MQFIKSLGTEVAMTTTPSEPVTLKISTLILLWWKQSRKVESNTASATSTSTRKTILRRHLSKIFSGGDEKDFFNPN